MYFIGPVTEFMYSRREWNEGVVVIKSPVRFFKSTCAAALFTGAVIFTAGNLQAGVTKESATISVTVQARASVGLATPPAAAPATTTSTSTSIPTVPISTTSNVGYGSPAPAAASSTTGSTGTGSDSGTSVTPSQAARAFASRGAAPVSLGGASAVAVAGGPNQTFNVILPGNTSYSDGGRVVNLSNFQHSAGTTPALGSNGSGTFSVGAAVGGNDTGSGGEQTNPQAAVSSAFTQRSPIVNIDVTYN